MDASAEEEEVVGAVEDFGGEVLQQCSSSEKARGAASFGACLKRWGERTDASIAPLRALPVERGEGAATPSDMPVRVEEVEGEKGTRA